MSPDSPASFRPIHYLGNKARFLEHIEAAVAGVRRKEGVALDLFSGSGVVSRALAMRQSTISVDIQAYSQVLADALTRPAAITEVLLHSIAAEVSQHVAKLPKPIRSLMVLEQEAIKSANSPLLADILESGSLIAGRPSGSTFADLHHQARHSIEHAGPENTMLCYYGGVYFSYSQAAELDAIVKAVRSLPGDARTTGLAAAMGVASELTSTVGNHFAQPIRPRTRDGAIKTGWTRRICKVRSVAPLQVFMHYCAKYLELSPALYPCTPIKGDYRAVLSSLNEGDVGVVYADPPYTRDHYSRFYHVLETLALGDDPGISVVPGAPDRPSRGLYRLQRHQSPFSIRTEVVAAFSQLFEECKRLSAPLVLSYSPSGAGTKARPQPRLMTIPQITDLAGGYFSKIAVVATGRVAHSKFNSQALNGEIDYDAEVLIVCGP